jgi:hypothetical protein
VLLNDYTLLTMEMASTGQTLRHNPQPKQAKGWMRDLCSPDTSTLVIALK